MRASLDRRSRVLLAATLLALALIGLRTLVSSPSDVTVAREPGDSLATVEPASAGMPELLVLESSERARQDAASAPGAWLRVLDQDTLETLRPAEIDVTPEGQSPLRLEDEASMTALGADLLGPCELRVVVPGYVPLAGKLALCPGENLVLVQRAGSLTIALVDATGDPVPGVDVVLLAPRVDGRAGALDAVPVDSGPRELVRTEAGWIRAADPVLRDDGSLAPAACAELASLSRCSTDAAGRAAWGGLPPHEGYRWAVAAPPLVDPTPPHEQRRFEEIGAELRAKALPPEGLSGSFEIVAGERLELTGTALSSAGVRGRIACFAADARAVVTLYRIHVGGGNTAKRGVSFDAVATALTDADGAFRFTDLRPTTWMVRAWWAEEGRELYTTGQTFVLAPGTELDLGLLQPQAGDSLEVTLGIADADGRSLDPAQVYAGAERAPFANLAFSAIPSGGDAVHLVTGILPLPFGERFRIHGLQPGRVLASVQPGEGLVADPRQVSKLEGAQDAFEVGSRSSLELVLVAHLGSSRPLVVRGPAGLELCAASVWVHDRRSDALSSVNTHPLRDEELGAGQTLTLPAGTYDLWCKLSTDDAPAGLVGRTSAVFDPARHDPIEIVVEPAASVSGVLRHPSGAPVAHQVLDWVCSDWPRGLYRTTTDAQGAFTLLELPAHAALSGAHPGTDLRPLEPGWHEGVELVWGP